MMPGPYFPSGTEAPIPWTLEKIRCCNFADQLGTTLKDQPSSRTLVPVGRTESSPSVQGPLSLLYGCMSQGHLKKSSA